MSVLVTSKNKHYSFVKGSPEKIKELSIPSTIPANYDQMLNI